MGICTLRSGTESFGLLLSTACLNCQVVLNEHLAELKPANSFMAQGTDNHVYHSKNDCFHVPIVSNLDVVETGLSITNDMVVQIKDRHRSGAREPIPEFWRGVYFVTWPSTRSHRSRRSWIISIPGKGG